LWGLDTDFTVTCPKLVAKVLRGRTVSSDWCSLGELGEELAAFDSIVLVDAVVKVKGKITADSYLRCYLGVAEYDEVVFGGAASPPMLQDKGIRRHRSYNAQSNTADADQ
jgi:hypothetical protein